MQTEQPNAQSAELDQRTTAEILQLMNAQDATVAAAVATALPYIEQAVAAAVAALKSGGRLFYVGAGTSGRLGVLDAVECVPTFSTPPELVQGIIAGGASALQDAVEGAEDDITQAVADLDARGVSAADVVVGLAASGHTPYTVAAVRYARSIGCVTVGLSCNQPAPLLDAAEIPIAVPVGAEVLTGSTRLKAGTAQKMVLNMISTATMVRMGKVYGNLMVDVMVTNDKLAARLHRIVQTVTDADDATVSAAVRDSGNNAKRAILMILRGVDRPTAERLLAASDGSLREALTA